MIYDKYIEQFDKIGYLQDRIVTVPNFIDKEDLNLINNWMNQSKVDGSIDKSIIDNKDVVNILLNSEKKIFVYEPQRNMYNLLERFINNIL